MKRLILALSTVLLMEYACINLDRRVEAADVCPAQISARYSAISDSQSGPWVRIYQGMPLPNGYWVRDFELGVPVSEARWVTRW